MRSNSHVMSIGNHLPPFWEAPPARPDNRPESMITKATVMTQRDGCSVSFFNITLNKQPNRT